MEKIPETSDEDLDIALQTYIAIEEAHKWFELGEYGSRKLTVGKVVKGKGLLELRLLSVPLVQKQRAARFVKQELEQ